MIISGDHIRNIAIQEGFTLCGIARCRTLSEHEVFFDQWLSLGYNSTLHYLERYRDKRFDPASLVQGAKSVIVCALNYKNNALNYSEHNNIPKIASYALAEDYHNTLRKMLKSLLEQLKTKHPTLCGRCFVDTAPLLEKAWAVESGLGWIGRNSLLINPQYGSYLLLCEIVIDMEVDYYDTPLTSIEGCAECQRCVEACPNGAICAAGTMDRVIDTRRCISQLTQYSPDCDPKLLHGWIFGCDECQSCCPYNMHPPPAQCGLMKAITPCIDSLTREYWQNISQEEFELTFGKTPLSRAKLSTIKTLTK